MSKNTEKKIKVLIVEPDKSPKTVEISHTLDSLQEIVGGYIEALYPFDDPVALICDEEGKLKGYTLNRSLRDDDGEIVDIIAGTFIVCGLSSDDFDSLSEDLIDKYKRLFRNPECFMKLGSRIISITVPAGYCNEL